MSDNAKSATAMTLAMLAYVISDALYKYYGANFPLMHYLFVRGVFVSLAFLAAILLTKTPPPRSQKEWILLIIRGMLECGLSICFLTALLYGPITNLGAILQLAPFCIAIGGYFLFGERFGWVRLSAIIFGFIGVIFVVQPSGEGSALAYILALASMFIITIRELLTRALPSTTPTLWVALLTGSIVSFMGFIGSRITGETMVLDWPNIRLIMLFAAIIIIAYFLTIVAMRIGEISFSSVFRYTSILFAAIADIVVFHLYPNALTIIGVVIITGSGIFLMRREAKMKDELVAESTHMEV